MDNAEPPFNYSKTAIWVFGSLSLAILGSALWDFAFKPLFLWCAEQIAFLTNLGSTALSDAMYQEIAKGNYERVSLIVYQSLLSLMLGIVTGALMVRQLRTREWIKRPSSRLLLIMIAIISGTMILQSIRTSYIVRAANHLEQLQSIVAPYVPQDQTILIRSKIAQIQTQRDYEGIVREMTEIINKNKLVLPTFDALK